MRLLLKIDILRLQRFIIFIFVRTESRNISALPQDDARALHVCSAISLAISDSTLPKSQTQQKHVCIQRNFKHNIIDTIASVGVFIHHLNTTEFEQENAEH